MFEKRMDLRVSLDILLNKYIKGRPYLCRASNISRRGILIHRIHEPTNAEKHIGLQFQLPGDDRVVTCAGRITYEHDWIQGNGILFTAVAPEHQELIDDFIMRSFQWVEA
jgi:hypothetical protein